MERNLDINTVLPSSVQMTNTQETMLSRRGNNKRQKPENRTPQRFSPQLMKSYWCLAHPVSVVSFVTSFSAPSHRPLRQRIYRSRQRGSYHKALECTDQNTNLMFILNVTTETFIVQGCTWLVIFFLLFEDIKFRKIHVIQTLRARACQCWQNSRRRLKRVCTFGGLTQAFSVLLRNFFQVFQKCLFLGFCPFWPFMKTRHLG